MDPSQKDTLDIDGGGAYTAGGSAGLDGDDALERTIAQWSARTAADVTPSMTITPAAVAPPVSGRRLQTVAVTGRGGGGLFEVSGMIGSGGMGEVESAVQMSLTREVALKRMRPPAATDQPSRERFVAEALVTGELEHPNIVPV